MAKVRRDLIIYNEVANNPIIQELEHQGFEVIKGLWQPSVAQLQRLFMAWVYFYDVLKINPKLYRLRRLLHNQAPLVAWNRDAPSYKGRPYWKVWLGQVLKPLDIYMSHSLADGKVFGSQEMYLANAVDPLLYNLLGQSFARLRQSEFYQVDVSFFGGLDGARHPGQRCRQIFFNELGLRLHALGISYRFFDAKGLSLATQVECIQSSRINLQYGASCEYLGQKAGGLPERCFGVPACGGFLLADSRVHTSEHFTLGKDYVEFSSMDDCVDKIQFYLQNFSQSRDLAETAYDHVLKHHTYQHRATSVIRAVESWHRNKGNIYLDN